jgi:ATP-binding cassette, subfamily B (MDR/TAP), member 1
VIIAALIIGCIFCWELTLVTSSGLAAIVLWYTVTTPLIAKRYAAIQDVEMEAAGVVSEAFSSVRMVAACGAEDKMSASYGQLTDKVRDMGKRMSPLVAVQYSPGMYIYRLLCILLM